MGKQSSLTSVSMYELADALGMTFDVDKNWVVSGRKIKKIAFATTELDVQVEIVSSHVVGAVIMVLLTVLGNLCLFVTLDNRGSNSIIVVHVLDLAKMDKLAGWLEKHQPSTIEQAKKLLGNAIVASFRRNRVRAA